MITVLNRRTLSPPLPGTLRIVVDRTSALGNPFPITSPDSQALVIKQYREWLVKQLQTRNRASAAFNHLLKLGQHHDLELVCCSPLDCADIIKELLEQRLYPPTT
jgi:hypothetical protein